MTPHSTVTLPGNPDMSQYVTHIFVFIFRKIVKQQLENQIIYFILLSTLEESLQVGE
jgi:hypothetical protein